MSAPTGIAVSEELSSAFSQAIENKDIRFLKVAIQNESLVPDGTHAPSGSLHEDLDKLPDLLEDDVPAYVLVRLDDPPTEWLAIYYVPDTAKIRDKMLYAATRNTLTKSLGSSSFTDSFFATNKNDLTGDAYRKHRQHVAAPQPMSAREKEIEEVKAAERQSYGTARSGGELGRVAQSHVGLNWSEQGEQAVRELGNGEGSAVVVLNVDPATETLLLASSSECSVEDLRTALPASEPSFAFFAWPQNITMPPRREIVYIYSCPSSSPVKHRMLYSSSFLSTYMAAQQFLLPVGSSTLSSRKIQVSDPQELTESYLASELGLAVDSSTTSDATLPAEKKPFAKPRGPARKR